VDSPQSWNRYSYVSNNPVRFNDPTGHVVACGVYEDDCEHGPALPSTPTNPPGGGDSDEDDLEEELDPTVVVFCGSYASDVPGYTISDPGPTCGGSEGQMPAWDWNPWDYEMGYVPYPGSKYQQAQDALNVDIGGPTILICYSAGTESCLIYAKAHLEAGYAVPYMVLIGPTFSGADSPTGSGIGAEGWYSYLDFAITHGTGVTVIDDSAPYHTSGDKAAWQYTPPDDSSGFYKVTMGLFQHYDGPGRIPMGVNNNGLASYLIYRCIDNRYVC